MGPDEAREVVFDLNYLLIVAVGFSSEVHQINVDRVVAANSTDTRNYWLSGIQSVHAAGRAVLEPRIYDPHLFHSTFDVLAFRSSALQHDKAESENLH